ncbi:MAG TPA: Ger(x)C family spore germination protein [Bacillota bacterium]|nr:Ger(x)C family spore germination protein [Bacillota bacterium]
MSKAGLFVKLIFVFLGIILISGCWGAREIDEVAYPLALGIDQSPGKNLVISVAVANITTGGAASNGNQPLSGIKTRVFTTEAPSMFTGLTAINTILERPISLGHLKIVVFSEAVARKGLAEYMDTLTRWRQFRRTIYIAVSQGEARNIMDAIIPPSEDNPGKFLELMLLTQGYVGYTPRGQLLKFYNALKTKGEDPIAMFIAPRSSKFTQTETQPQDTVTGNTVYSPDPGNYTAAGPRVTGEGPLQFLGTAIFKKDKMVDKLTGNETLGFSLMRGEFSRTFVSVPDPESPDKLVQIELSRIKKPRVTLKRDGNIIRAKVELYVLGDIASVPSNHKYELPSRIPLLEKSMKKWIGQYALAAFRKAQSNNADIFGFGDYAHWLAPDWKAWQQWNWEETFRSLDLDLKVVAHVDRTGLIIEKNAVRED